MPPLHPHAYALSLMTFCHKIKNFPPIPCFCDIIYSRLSKCSTAKGSSTGLVPVDPTKVKALISILFTESTPEVEIKNTCLIQLSHFILSHFASMRGVIAI